MSKAIQAYSDEFVMSHIHVVRGLKVMLDGDLAQVYGVETKVLNQAVRRNAKRFPEDFMFRLTQEEAGALRSQTVTLKRGTHSKYLPYAFTEHGVLMLSNVLRSERAVLMSIQIIRVFTRMREMLVTHKDLLLELEKLRNTSKEHTGKIAVIFKYLKQMEQRQEETELLEEIRRGKAKNPIGFKAAKGRRARKK